MSKRIFLIVLDSLGIGALPDADKYGDEGSNTLKSIRSSSYLTIPNLTKLGLLNVDTVEGGVKLPLGSFARLKELSNGKDTTIGHWELAGIVSTNPLPTFPNGFPNEIIKEFERLCGVKTVCNKPYSGTEVIKDYGDIHLKTGALIVYTSADSVFQIASHESIVPVETLYKYSKIARDLLKGKYGVGRVIARPFTGEYPFTRTPNRHDFSLLPPKKTMLNTLSENGYKVISVGKISDIFASNGITESYPTSSNLDGMSKTLSLSKKDFEGICFVNLVDFDSKYGHRNDVDGYAKALSQFDKWLDKFLPTLLPDDLLIITADHGCDPKTPSTDHSREYVPMIIYGQNIKSGVNLKTLNGFSCVAETVLNYFDLPKLNSGGKSFLSSVIKK